MLKTLKLPFKFKVLSFIIIYKIRQLSDLSMKREHDALLDFLIVCPIHTALCYTLAKSLVNY